MQCRRRGITITNQCTEAYFGLTGEYKAECIEGVGMFMYLGRSLDWSDDNWPEVLRNISKAHQVWG